MIYRICHCVTTQCGRRAVVSATRRQKNAHAHTRTCAPSGGNCGRFFGPQVCFKKMRSLFARQIGLSAETSFAAHTYAYGCGRMSQKWARSSYSRTKERGGEGRMKPGSDSMRQKDGAHSYKFVSQQSGSCAHGHGHISL